MKVNKNYNEQNELDLEINRIFVVFYLFKVYGKN